ncbi:MMPL family transporter [Tenacibaculum caenipelagi]|uniref:Phospholipid/glycerol acyltransferase domain-containing protein n=1 Tax=Tenacibaculum caenipelagi TaxID=1325435 RepID=A0A4R6TF58_9FLAO|nr:MMPL family transporter [Tenacibaculum caenipelagi]TDQ28867.1 hypothetical protein DFQ07_1248 [Tenacibaculum caenipelagi]
MSNLLYSIFKFFNQRKIVSLVVIIGLFSGLLYIASNIKFEEDILKLVPQTNQSSEAKKVLENTNFSDKIIFKIQRKDSVAREDLTKFATVLIDSLQKNKLITKVSGVVNGDDVFKITDFIYENLPLFLDKEDYQAINSKIESDNLESLIEKNYHTLISPTGSFVKKQILKDPLGLSFIALKKLQKLGVGNDLILKDGFLMSSDEKSIILFVDTKFPPSETEKNSVLVSDIDAIVKDLHQTYKNIDATFFGAAVVAVENASQIKSDIQLTVSIALTVLFIILIVYYKKIATPLILFVPTLFGGVLAISFLYFFRENVSAISLGIGAVLLGITLDYSLHILSYIKKEDNIEKLYQEISKPILISSLTTASAFLCLLFLKSQALQDLGVFASVSVVGASIVALLFIPHVYNPKRKTKEKAVGIERFLQYPIHRNKWWVLVVVTLIIVGAFNYEKVKFNKDLSKLNYKSEHLQEVENSLNKLTNISEKSVYLVAYGSNLDSVLRTNETILDKLKSLKNKDQIIEIKSVSELISSKKKQEKKIVEWNSFWTKEKQDSLKSNLNLFGTAIGFKPDTFNSFIEKLNKNYNPIDFNDKNDSSLLPINDYVSNKNSFITVTNIVKIKEGFVDEVKRNLGKIPGVYIIDRKEMNEVFLGGLKNNFNFLMKGSFLVVLVLLILFYKNIYLTVITVLPVLLTWVITVGLMGVLHIDFNIFNIIISSFIFGLGIDYSIFITSALQKEYATGKKYLPNYKSAIILSVITTILGVGVLIFAKHPALYSISVVSIIGVLSALLLSFTIQPLLFKLFIGTKTRESLKLHHLIFSTISFAFFGLGGLLLSLFSVSVMKIIPVSKKVKMKWFHKTVSKFMSSVLWSYPFLRNKVINNTNEDFSKQALIIANHNSFLDILTIGKLHPKMIFLVNDWVYNSPIFGKAVQLAGFYPVSKGIDEGLNHIEEKIKQGYSVMVFPEGTRSETNKIRRFHKGAFYLAETFKLDIVPVLIHGASEVLPKGNFIIKKGTITAKILPRIAFKEATFGSTYSEKTKQIGRYFKEEHLVLRRELETSSYFYKTIVNSYLYRGKKVYNQVKLDLKNKRELYSNLLLKLNEKESITHLSEDYGQLDFLLTLDSLDRKIIIHNNSEKNQELIKSNYLVKHKKITLVNDFHKALALKSNVLIINRNLEKEEYKLIEDQDFSTIVILQKDVILENFNKYTKEGELPVILKR